MVLTKQELVASLQQEVRVFLHLASKVDSMKLDYRPTSKQRSTLELVQYMAIMGPIHLRAEIEMFGQKATRGLWIVRLVWCHYAAYRMQLFLYLKASGREELSTLNLWVGMDAAYPPFLPNEPNQRRCAPLIPKI
jgi:hypothetical protein